MKMDKKQIIKDWFQRVWIDMDLDAVDEYFEPDTEAEGLLPDFGIGPNDFKVFVPMCRALLESLEVHVDKVLEEGNWVSAITSMRAVNPTTGQPFAAHGQLFCRFKEDKIVEAYNAFDYLSFFTQLGYLPPQSLELGLTGQKIA
ncbi:ketosteroid isomerase-like protein [Shimia isoporae]|uniref:Ketosteroid isomerase-like protein n=1 Tax=Shimia isoporae TaxID=647720 RepID=A0A4R1NNY0_9RHOB|nr:ester cyclase [Shimia isoporae]TCL09529.1 ketosteroid isomerase-like protein [Shimia isoporae]